MEEDGESLNGSSGQAQNEISYVLPGVHRKLRGYKFDNGEELYEYLLEHRSPKEKTVISKALAKSSLEALKCVSITFCWELQGKGQVEPEISSNLAKLLSRLIYGIQGARFESQGKKCLVKIVSKLSSTGLLKLVKALLDVDKNLACLSLAYSWIHQQAVKEVEEEMREKVVDLYVKEVLMTKVPKSEWVVKKVASTLLPCFNGNSACEDTILAAISKSLLRSPETSVEAISYSLNAMKMNLKEDTVKELAKRLGSCLSTENEKMKLQAAFASQALFNGLSTDDLRKAAINEYFELVSPTAKGSKSVLASAAKITVLCVIKEFGLNTPKGSETNAPLATWVLEKCTRLLETDVHEGTLLESMEVIGAWINAIDKDCPAFLTKYIKNGLSSLKGSVRLGLCRMMVNVYNGNRFLALKEVLTSIIKCIETALGQHSVVNSLTEAISLSLVLLNGSSSQTIPEQAYTLAVKAAGYADDKFLGTCTSWALTHATMLVRHFPTASFQTSFNIVDRSFALGMHCLPFTDYKTRCIIQSEMVNMMTSTEDIDTRAKLAKCFLSETRSIVLVEKTSDQMKYKIVKVFAAAVAPCVRNSKPDVQQRFACEFLEVAHSFLEENLWYNVVQRTWGLDAKEILEKEKDLVYQNYVKNFYNNNVEVGRRILRTLVKIHSDLIMGEAVDSAVRYLESPNMLKISRDDYFIFRTPEGQLYNISVIESSGAGGDSARNMKRESKVYSYQEQLEEIQLRKELEEKRKRAGKGPAYTAKQIEAIKTQLAKESLIREQVATLHQQVTAAFVILSELLETDPENFGLYVKDFIDKLVEVMQSPVAAPPAIVFFINLGNSLFSAEGHCFGEKLAQCFLRLVNPLCDLNQNWQQTEISNMVVRVLEQLKESSSKSAISNAVLSYIYPFCERVLRNFSRNASIVSAMIQIINNFSSLSIEDTDSIPRAQYTKLMYQIVEKDNNGATQTLAASTLVAFLKTANAGMCFIFLDSIELQHHLEALKSATTLARDTSLTCLDHLCQAGWMTEEDNLKHILAASVYREQYDPVARIADLGKKVWEATGLPVDFTLYEILSEDILHIVEAVRISAAKACGALLTNHKDKLPAVLEQLRNNYNDYEELIPPVVDSFGRVLEEAIDKWEGRCGIGLTIRELAPLMSKSEAEENMKWIVTQTLGDRSNAVHVVMLEAAVEIVKIHGSSCLNGFIDIIETFLENATKSRRFDNVRQACVVLMGSLAKHLDPKDKRVKSIFETLLETLSTPSEKVQEAVANCLPGLVPAVKDDADAIVAKLTAKMMGSDNFGERRGAAYGLAGLIKGLGILSLKQHDIMNMLANGMQDKKDFKKREGALMALELLCQFLGRLFEPYIVHVLPYLLQCLGDSNVYVREATENTAKRVMSRLSGHGVKLVLPALLAALNEDSWRTKCGSVELLGRMAYCAPRQLSGCLPMIVPKLIEVLGDSHVKVQDASTKALSLIGSVIQNPEVASVVPVLLEALQDPGKKASSCLQALLQTEFVHFVDPPSLALIMPVVQRAFQDRSTENRKMACQIIGNMYSLTDHSDLAPYMDNVMPGIKASLLDPVPEVRAVAAKALGAMAKGMGEKCYEELLPWLMKTLVSDVNSVDRSGAAQGLAEVIGALGEENLHKFMPEIIRKADSDDLAPHVRDGYMMMFIYMPGVFEDAFVKYIGQIINPILKALADENEYVRETALRAGQRIVTGFAESAITLLLPELEKGVFDDNWRIRYSSVQLLGDLLYKISGVSGKMSTESANDDDNFGTEQSQKLIIAALGHERRNRVLAGLYMGRSDVALMVRQASLHVWKVIVANTPKTLREILPTLFSLLLGCLAAASHDKRTVAARTLGDLVRKLGEKILPEIIPILEKGLESQRADERQGVCIGLCEIMANTSKEMILAFVDNLVPTLRKALCDPKPEVRQAAALTFGSLHSNVGSRAMEEIVPYLMKKLSEGDQEEADQALDGLGQILIVKSKSVMPYLIPQLTAKPPNTRAMAILASVANDAMSKHLGKILPCLLEVLMDNAGLPQEAQELENCNGIILTVTDDMAVRTLVDDLLENSKSENFKLKRAAVTLLSVFCVHSKADLSAYVAQLLRGLIMLMTETDDAILHLVADAVSAIVKNLDSAEKLGYVADLRQAIMFVRSDLKGKEILPGVCLPKKGINPMLPIYREAVLNGSTDMKEQATIGMGELIILSSEEALKPSVINVTGPLIRILGDRYGPSLKCAVLDTLTLLLVKVGPHLKAFLPQLQTTFLKSSVDQNRNVRLKAAVGLAQLLPIHNKPDPMFQDLLNSLKTNDDVSHRDTLLYTLRCTSATGGHKISEATKKSVLNALWNYIGSQEESTNTVTAGAIGVLLQHLPDPEFDTTISSLLTEEIDPSVRQAKTSALAVGLKMCPQRIVTDKLQDKVYKCVLFTLGVDRPSLVANGIRACCHIFIHCLMDGKTIPATLVSPFVKTINNSSNEVKTLLGQVSEVMGRKISPQVLPKEIGRYLITALVNGTKEKNSIVRASCETALICILRLRDGDNAMNTCLEYLDSGAREALNDVINKVLRKTLKEPESREPDIDDTILT